MTPPSIERAVEILTAAAAARRDRTHDQAAQLTAAAIDVILARMAHARRIEDDLVSWRADVEAATLDHGWMITGHIDALLAPLVAAQDPTATEPGPPVPADRLREIAAGEYRVQAAPRAHATASAPLSHGRLTEIAGGIDIHDSPFPDDPGAQSCSDEVRVMARALLASRPQAQILVFEGREGRARGDITDVVASCDPASLVSIRNLTLIDEPPGISVGFVIDAAAVQALKERAAAQAAPDPDPAPGTRVRVTVGNMAGFVGVVQPRGDDDPPGWSRVRSDGRLAETRLFESKHLDRVP